MKKKHKRGKTSAGSLASIADRHSLYERSVQCAEAEIDFVDATFKRLRNRKGQLLREDFCGTANVCCEWVRRGGKRRAIGVDLDPEVLSWGRSNNLARLTRAQRARITLIEDDVIHVRDERPDIVLAMNFSYWLIKDRILLKRYFKRVRRALASDGVFFLDTYGGYDSHKEIIEEREIDDGGASFIYVWEQERFDPVNHLMTSHIHFAFPDGSEIREAFSYHWRLWTIPELRDLLMESGFSRVTVYWQGWDKQGEPDGNFRPATSADADAGWICYLSAEK